LNANAKSFQLNGKYEEQIRRYEMDKQELMVKLADIETVYAETKQHNTELIVKLENSDAKLADTLTDIQPKQVRILELENMIKTLNDELTKRLEETHRLREENEALLQSRNCTEINKHLPSCDAIRSYGYKKSGFMMIDPDGEAGEDPFQVYCDMDTSPERGITIINHANADIGVEVSGCEDPGCFSHSIDYQGVSVAQVKGLISRSIHCEQMLRYDCFDSKVYFTVLRPIIIYKLSY